MNSVQFAPIKKMITGVPGLKSAYRPDLPTDLRTHAQPQPDVFVPRFGAKSTQGAGQPFSYKGLNELEKHTFQLAGLYPANFNPNVPAEDPAYLIVRSLVLNAITQDMDHPVPVLDLTAHNPDAELGNYMQHCAYYSFTNNLKSLAKAIGLPEKADFNNVEQAVIRLTDFFGDVFDVKTKRLDLLMEAISKKAGIPLQQVYMDPGAAITQVGETEVKRLIDALPSQQDLQPEVDKLKQDCAHEFSQSGVTLASGLLDRIEEQAVWIG